MGQHVYPLLLILSSMPLIFVSYHFTLTTLTQTGLLATALSIVTQLTCLDTVQVTLRTRDASTVNVGLVAATIVNGIVWAAYALVVSDMYVLLPNLCALSIASINLNLYHWAQGKL